MERKLIEIEKLKKIKYRYAKRHIWEKINKYDLQNKIRQNKKINKNNED